MDINRIVKLLKSPVLEDTLVGLKVLVSSYTTEEIIDIFNKYGAAERENPYLCNTINRNISTVYKGHGTLVSSDEYYLSGEIGFFVGAHITPIEHSVYVDRCKKSTMIMYNINEL